MAQLSDAQKKFEINRTVTAVRAIYAAGHATYWTSAQLAQALTDALATDGRQESQGENLTAAGWILEGLAAGGAMEKTSDGRYRLSEEAIQQYHNKSNFFSFRCPVGAIKIRQGAVVTLM